MTENDDGHVDGAEDGEFMGLLEQTALPLQKGAKQREVSEAMPMKPRGVEDCATMWGWYVFVAAASKKRAR